MRRFAFICFTLVSAGCSSVGRSGNEDFVRYVEFCRGTAMTTVKKEDPEDPMSKVDWMVNVAGTTRNSTRSIKSSMPTGNI